MKRNTLKRCRHKAKTKAFATDERGDVWLVEKCDDCKLVRIARAYGNGTIRGPFTRWDRESAYIVVRKTPAHAAVEGGGDGS